MIKAMPRFPADLTLFSSSQTIVADQAEELLIRADIAHLTPPTWRPQTCPPCSSEPHHGENKALAAACRLNGNVSRIEKNTRNSTKNFRDRVIIYSRENTL
ncbi:hypothetical protein NDU88_003126 [Pleurodeles waltl]|uniref:Uncharacterized protein n=1 Tax=Pleurodeles waltl TaxID=8319 RepID=A0AAV7VF81_PLEWA|nr:hypothetical protein NDU88_003126 [Pleurodeles waltl]